MFLIKQQMDGQAKLQVRQQIGFRIALFNVTQAIPSSEVR
jgi:hypothetical protein